MAQDPNRGKGVLPEDMQPEGLFESSAIEFAGSQLQICRNQAVQ